MIWDGLMLMWYWCNGVAQDCSNSIANALELLQSCAKPLISNVPNHSCTKPLMSNRWVRARKAYVQSVSNGVTSFLRWPIEISQIIPVLNNWSEASQTIHQCLRATTSAVIYRDNWYSLIGQGRHVKSRQSSTPLWHATYKWSKR